MQNGPVFKKKMLLYGFILVMFAFTATAVDFAPSFVKPQNPVEPLNIHPEYDRHLDQVVICLRTIDKDLDMQANLIHNFPDYTQVIFLLPEKNIPAIRKAIRANAFAQNIRLIGFNPPRYSKQHAYLIFPDHDKLIDTGPMTSPPCGALWTQDLFEVAIDRQRNPFLLVSDVYKWFLANDDEPLNLVSDIGFVENLTQAGLKMKRLPLTFRGGNILTDCFKGKKIGFCGGDNIRLSRTVWTSFQDNVPSDQELIDMLQTLLGLDEVHIISRDKVQPEHMFHLDQAMVLLAQGVAGVTRIVKEKETVSGGADPAVQAARQCLSELGSTLSRLGYRTVPIDITARNLLNFQFYVNGIPYRDARTGQKTYLMPVYPDQQTNRDRELIQKNIGRLETLGYRVITVSCPANRYKGGIHCLANVIS